MSFPVSLLTSINAAIGEEIIFRLFLIPFLMWLIHHVILRGKWGKQAFWTSTGISAAAFVLFHVLYVMLKMGWSTIALFPPAYLAQTTILNGVLSLFTAYYFRKFGPLAPVGIHFWAASVWFSVRGIM
jgi:predicted Abi (CAAX) family protease